MYKVIVVSEAQDDLDKLPDDVLLEVLDYFSKYETDPYKYSHKCANTNEDTLAKPLTDSPHTDRD